MKGGQCDVPVVRRSGPKTIEGQKPEHHSMGFKGGLELLRLTNECVQLKKIVL